METRNKYMTREQYEAKTAAKKANHKKFMKSQVGDRVFCKTPEYGMIYGTVSKVSRFYVEVEVDFNYTFPATYIRGSVLVRSQDGTSIGLTSVWQWLPVESK